MALDLFLAIKLYTYMKSILLTLVILTAIITATTLAHAVPPSKSFKCKDIGKSKVKPFKAGKSVRTILFPINHGNPMAKATNKVSTIVPKFRS